MPHWTPDKSGTVVYATVSEAHSGSADDVSSYLFKLRKHLHNIGKQVITLINLKISILIYTTHYWIKNMRS